jgi:hypothetical protein
MAAARPRVGLAGPHRPEHRGAAGTGDRRQVAGQARQRPGRQPGEGRRLHVVRVDAVPAAVLDGGAGQARREALEQLSVVAAAAADDQPLRRRGPERGGHAGSGEFAQRRLHGDRRQRPEARRDALQPGHREVLRPGALGGRQGQEGMLQQRLEQRLGGLSRGGPGAGLVVGPAEMPARPGIHQAVGRAGVEAGDGPAGLEQRQVGHAAQVEHGAVFPGGGEHGRMEAGHQRRALAAQRHVPAPKVRHHRNAGARRNPVRVADLQREGRRAAGPMTQRLAVAADGADTFRRQSALRQQRQGRRRESLAGQLVQLAQLIDGVVGAGGEGPGRRQAAQARREAVREGRSPGGEDPEPVPARLGERGVDRVHGGPGDQAEVESGRKCRGSGQGAAFSRRLPAAWCPARRVRRAAAR